ncbi:MAG: hypothetical protein IPF98_02050 [Gemmatimonadetes bacterium]|nr:hypothetical protein [Gemmatimonadota bacterium]
MTAIFDQTLGTMVAAPAGARVAPEAEAVVARMAQLAFEVASSAGRGELLRALATGSSVAFLRVFAELLVSSTGPSAAAMEALRGQLALAESVELSGGLWRADEAQAALGVSRATLQSWRDAGRVIALPQGDGSYAYPVAQFLPPATDLDRPRPDPAIGDVLRAAGTAIGVHELFLLLAAPQPALATAGGGERTGFEALRAGEGALVEALVAHVVTPSDAGAPDSGETPSIGQPAAVIH